MPSVINSTVIWRGKTGERLPEIPMASSQFAVRWRFTDDFYIIPRPQLATRLLAHKIQSPQEWEAMQALLVSIDLSRQVLCRQLLHQRRSPEGCIYGAFIWKWGLIGVWFSDHSADSAVLFAENGTGDSLNCKDYICFACVSHPGCAPVADPLVPHQSGLHACCSLLKTAAVTGKKKSNLVTIEVHHTHLNIGF